MKPFLILLFFIQPYIVTATLVTWDGEAGDGLWSSAANWNNNVVPSPGDDVLLDNSLLAGNYSVSLPGGTITVTLLTITIAPAGSNTIILLLPAFNTANPGLLITGTGDALVINKGGVLKNSSRVSPGSGIVINNSFRINNGGRYIHNTSSGNAGIVAQLSAAAGTETGIFEYDIPFTSNTISLSGRTYGILELSAAANGGSAIYIGSGAMPLAIKGDLNIKTGASFRISMSADCIIGGNYNQAAASVFDLQSSTGNNSIKINGTVLSQGTLTKSGTGLPAIEFNGNSNQNITIKGAFTNNVTVRMNNPAGVTLLSPLAIPFHLQLIKGKIKTSATNLLTMSAGIATGGSSTSFVEGPMRKAGNDASFLFPVGKGSIYAPAGFHCTGMAATDTIMAEYMRANPQSVCGINYENLSPPLQFDHISYVEYWQLRKTAGTILPMEVTLTVTPYSFSKNMNSLFVARYNTSDMQWKNGGIPVVVTGIPAPPYVTGTITSAGITGDGVFTLYTNEHYPDNPLPVRLVSLTVIGDDDGNALLKWEVGNNNHDISFEVERAGPDHRFIAIGMVKSVDMNYLYSYIDEHLQNGTNYYRLKIIDNNAGISYSNVTAFQSHRKALFITASLSGNNIAVEIASGKTGSVQMLITDRLGRQVKQLKYLLNPGKNTLIMPAGDLPVGIYFLMGIFEKERTKVVEFVKYQ